jgi:AcrR family transcriptional regulator
MDSVDTTVAPGLRERKKQRTRETIERAALELFAERGYNETTLADIADAADVSRRTIFSYFENKEDILFCEEGASIDGIKEMLEQRPAGTTTVQALREFIGSVPPPDEEALLRKKIVSANPELLMRARAHIAGLESVLADSIAKDLGAGPDDVRPALIAASMTAAFTAVREQFEAGDDAGNHERGMEIVDQVLEFLQGGLAALQRG